MSVGSVHHKARRGVAWLSWLLGAALLGAVIVGVLHFTEHLAFAQLLQRANPAWIVAAILLQAGTYAAQGGVWRGVASAAGYDLSRCCPDTGARGE